MKVVGGEVLVWKGHGLVRVEGARELHGTSFCVVKSLDTGATMMVPVATVETVVRPLVSRADAERLAARLREPGASDARPWAERFHDAMVVLVKRPLDAQVDTLHALYRTNYALTFGERKLIDTFERAVVGGFAHVLGEDLDAMVAELRAAHPAFTATLPSRPPEPEVAPPVAPLELDGHTYLGAMSIASGRIVVGEVTAPAKDTFVAHGAPGVWHAYVADANDDDDGRLVAIHADAADPHARLLDKLVAIANVNVEGGTMALVDADVRDDEAFQEATMFPVDPIVHGRGCVVRTGGDGAHRVRGAKLADRLAVLVVDF